MNQFANTEIITSNGLVMKNADRLRTIRSRFAYEFTMTCLSWQISRFMRRDFNIMSSYIFSQCQRNHPNRGRLNDFLLELHLQAEELKARSKIFDVVIPTEKETKLPIKVVSSETALLYKSLKIADFAMATLNAAHEDGLLTFDRRDNMAYDFLSTFNNLRRMLIVVTADSNKTASELGQEIGIS